jgi:hypothetical protein
MSAYTPALALEERPDRAAENGAGRDSAGTCEEVPIVEGTLESREAD